MDLFLAEQMSEANTPEWTSAARLRREAAVRMYAQARGRDRERSARSPQP
jgi:hypothetical protein